MVTNLFNLHHSSRSLPNLLFLLVLVFLPFLLPPPTFAETPNRSWETSYDHLNIRRVNGMRTDQSPDFLTKPSYGPQSGYLVAQTPPRVHFGIVQLNPEYLPGGYPRATYGGWGEGVVGPNGRYYFGIGNHASYADSDAPPANAVLISYDPVSKTHRTELSNQQICGWSDTTFGDGKLHGEPDIAPNGDMWLLGFWGAYPSRSDWGSRYTGGRLIKYNINTRQAECLGQPVNDDAWPIHTWDYQRQRLYAIGEWGVTNDGGFSGDTYRFNGYGAWDYGKLLVYNTQNRSIIHDQVPSTGGNRIRWWRRGLLLDRTTGMLYGTETASPYNFVRYNPSNNSFSRMNATLSAPMISWPKTKNADGSFFVFDRNGGFYKFYPEEDRVHRIGSNYGSSYTETMRLSPGGRYLYYVPESNSSGKVYGFPIVQYDVETGQNKVIAFLTDFILEKYGYGISGNYGLALSADGAHLYAHVNGTFTPTKDQASSGRPAIIHIEIPASERSGESGTTTPTAPPTTNPTSPPSSNPPTTSGRTVPTQSERGSYFTYPYNDDYAGMGLISFGALSNNIYDRMPENGLTLKHARFHHFNSWDDTGGHTGFPYSKLMAFNDAEIAAGRPPVMVTATYQGKTRYVYFQAGYPAGNNFQLADVADDRYIRFFAEEFVRKIAYPGQTTCGPTDYVSSDEGMFRPTNYGVFSDSGSFVRYGSSGLVMNDPFWKTDAQYYEDVATFHRRLKQLYPDIKIVHNAGSMGDWSYFEKVYEYADGVAHEELPAMENGVITDRDNMYDWWVRHKFLASKNKIANVRIQDINPNNPDLVRTAYVSYLMIRGNNYFHNIQTEPTKEINPALLKDIRDKVGDPIGEWDSTQESGRSRGYRLYSRQTTKGMIYLNVSGTTKTITLPNDKTYYSHSGGQTSTITLADSQGTYVTFEGDPRPTDPPINPNLKPGDINQDGIVDLTDYSILVSNFLKSGSGNPADINQDNIVDLTDYSILVSNFLK